MTTLPQTMSNRARPAQSVNGVPAVASPVVASLPMPYAPQQQGSTMTGADIWRVFRQNIWLILIALVVSAGLGIGLFYYLDANHRKWTATGFVEVRTAGTFDPTGTLRIDDEFRQQELKTMLQNHAHGITSDQLLVQLLTRPDTNVNRSTWLREEASRRTLRHGGGYDSLRAQEVLRRALSARPITDSALIMVSLTAGDEGEAVAMLTEIVSARMNQVTERNQQSSSGAVRAMESMAMEIDQKIDNLTRDLQIQSELRSGDGEAISFGGARAIDHEMIRVITMQAEIEERLASTQSMLDSSRRSIERGVDPPSVDQHVEQNGLVVNYRNQLHQYNIAIANMAGDTGAGSRHMQRLQRARDNTAQELENIEHNIRASARQQLIINLETAVAELQQRLEELNKQRARLGESMAQFDMQEKRYMEVLEELNAQRLLRRDLQGQIAVARTALSERPKEELVWAARPQRPTSPSFPKLPIIVGGAMLFGVGLAVGLAFLREMADTSVRSPRDITRVGQMNVLGMIPDQDDDPQAGDIPELAIAKAPHSLTAEQFRAVRSRLGHAAPLETTRTILITSPGPDDGKTTVACNLAAGLALNGRKVLLVDANFRRPRIHKVFNVPNEGGLSAALGDAEQLAPAVHETSVPNLFVLPAGQKPGNPTELLEGPNFTDVIDRALEEFDHVIFDSGPILFVSETGAIAPQMDGVVSVVRARRNSRGLLGRMRDSLKSLNVEHLGVVLNAVRAQAGGYYNRNIKTFYAYQSEER